MSRDLDYRTIVTLAEMLIELADGEEQDISRKKLRAIGVLIRASARTDRSSEQKGGSRQDGGGTMTRALPTCIQPRPGLTVYGAIPPGCFGFLVEGDESDPLLKDGEFAVIDAADREPEEGALFLIEWSQGEREIVEANQRPMRLVSDVEAMRWWVASYNRPRGLHELNAAFRAGRTVSTSDGPYAPGHLADKIVGKVVGVLAPDRHSREELQRRRDIARCPPHVLADGYGAKPVGYIEPAGSASYRQGGAA